MREVTDYELISAMGNAMAMLDPNYLLIQQIKRLGEIQREAIERRCQLARMRAESQHAIRLAEFHQKKA